MSMSTTEIPQVKDHYVIWSGGCDSSMILHQLCTYFKDHNKTINALVIDHYMTSTLMGKLSHKNAREVFLAELKSKGFDVNVINIDVTGSTYEAPKGRHGLPQPSMWAGLVTPYISNGGALYFGYIRGDDFWHYRNQFEKIIHLNMEMWDKTCTLSFPLEFTEKHEVIRYLHGLNLLDKTWYCELPDRVGEPCKKCASCKDHIMAMYKLASRGTQWAKNELDKLIGGTK